MDVAAAAPARTGRPWVAIAAIVAIVLIAAAAWTWSARQTAQAPVIAVGEIANETGKARYAPLARATGELILNELGERSLKVRRGGTADLSLQSKLIIWDEKPFVSLSATDREGAFVWSAMLESSPGGIRRGWIRRSTSSKGVCNPPMMPDGLRSRGRPAKSRSEPGGPCADWPDPSLSPMDFFEDPGGRVAQW